MAKKQTLDRKRSNTKQPDSDFEGDALWTGMSQIGYKSKKK